MAQKQAQLEFDRLLDVSEITVADEVQAREQIDQGVIDEYAEAIKDGVAMPPLDVFRDGSRYVLGDGRHRLEAHKKAGIAGVQCRIHEGGFREAKLWAAGANRAHGLRRSNADKRKAVVMLLEDDEWSTWSDHRIANHCGVSQPFVSKLRRELAQLKTVITPDAPQSVRIGADGKARNVANVGGRSSGRPRQPQETQAPELREFELPELRSDTMYYVHGIRDDLFRIDPIPGQPGYYYTAHITGIGTGEESIHQDMRGFRYDHGLLKRKMREEGFIPASSWKAQPALGEKPPYVPTERERWALEALKWYELEGAWPWEGDSDETEAEDAGKTPRRGERRLKTLERIFDEGTEPEQRCLEKLGITPPEPSQLKLAWLYGIPHADGGSGTV